MAHVEDSLSQAVLGGIIGLAVGDALGVPVESVSRDRLKAEPVTGMIGHGAHNMPAGSWSDDTSLTLALLDGLTHGLDQTDLMQRFVRWAEDGAYTPAGRSFGFGRTTLRALYRFANGASPEQCGGTSERDNGNGALMRILPLGYYLQASFGPGFVGNDQAISTMAQVVSLTHNTVRNQLACAIYLAIVGQLVEGVPPAEAVRQGLDLATARYGDQAEWAHFERLAAPGFAAMPEDQINSGGYVVDTLEAAVWCLLNHTDYANCVLAAVNLGGDTDTTAAVAGGLAGTAYGSCAVPAEWLDQLIRRDYIEQLCHDFNASLAALAVRLLGT